MNDFGTISSIDSLPLPDGPHVKDFDAAQRAAKIAARAAGSAAATGAPPQAEAVAATPAHAASGARAANQPQALNLNASQSLVPRSQASVTTPIIAESITAAVAAIPTPPIDPTELKGKSLEDLDRMVGEERKLLDAISRAGQELIRKRLMVIFDEMAKRFAAGEAFKKFTGNKAMGAYLRSIGVDPGKLRVWKFLLRKEETAALAGESVPPPKKRKKPEIVIKSETETDLVAKAGVKMAQLLVGDGMASSPQERFEKAEAVAKDVLEAVADGRHDRLGMPQQPQLSPIAASHSDLLTPARPPEGESDEDALIAQYDPDREGREGRPIYKVMLTVSGSKLETMLKKAKEAFGEALLTVEKVSRVSSRADELADAMGRVSAAKDDIESLKSDIESWRDNLPDAFRDGEKGSQLEECMEALDQVISSLDDAESNADSVEFPGMY